MKSRNEWIRTARALAVSLIVAIGILQRFAAPAWAGERKFIVMLANSPKEFPGPGRQPPRQPTGGLIARRLIDEQYFDKLNPQIGSFAEYWEEISYGDVTITGQTTDWISLPWALRPPLSDPGDDNATTGPQANAERIRPADFFDLNRSAEYEYGHGERFYNSRAMVNIDYDGASGGQDLPPPPTPGSGDTTSTGDAVWRPGERFVDMDRDGRWDGLDEATNSMDWNGNQRADLLGPWTDLNRNGEADNQSDCVYLPDSDNDGNPDCCPDGPGGIGCWGYYGYDPSNPAWVDKDGPYDCPAMRWEGPRGVEIVDCNGNLIDDAEDIRTRRSLDRLPYTEECTIGAADGIPDECQFANHLKNCITHERSNLPDDKCFDVDLYPDCTLVVNRLPDDVLTRCEYDDANGSGTLDVVEPFENFLRRWDPCMVDPDADVGNQVSGAAHWIKVYDPNSSAGPLACGNPMASFRYQDSTRSTGVPSYIQNNYPGDADAVEDMATVRELWGDHDPGDKISTAYGTCRCADGRNCKSQGGILNACQLPHGHAAYDPPDYWLNQTREAPPGGRASYSAKMQQVPGAYTGTTRMLPRSTPEPGTYRTPPFTGVLLDDRWFPQAWLDRYVGGPNHPLLNSPIGRAFIGCADSNGIYKNCEVPSWPDAGLIGRTPNISLVRPFEGDDEDTYLASENRRYFHANRGGLNGRGGGWIGCGTGDPPVVFETGVTASFDVLCDAPIMPEEQNGEDQAPIFYDGWVEHDDLPSSKYHKAGDQRLGEVTSPFEAWYDEDGYPVDEDPLDPAVDTEERRLPAIWGQDRGDHNPDTVPILDNVVPAAGPYARHIHGNFGRDAGNQLAIELLTWRTKPPFNNGTVWESHHGWHPYAGPSGAQLGFRDYNLDGLIDQGETRPAGSENYVADSCRCTVNDGLRTDYPFNRRRLLEDCIEVVDGTVDFDDYVDAGAMYSTMNCSGAGTLSTARPVEYMTRLGDEVAASGIASGIVLLSPGPDEETFAPIAPWFYPIHTEDGLGDSRYAAANLPSGGNAQLSWHLFFHDLVKVLNPEEDVYDAFRYDTMWSTMAYMLTWQAGFRELWDFDELSTEDGVLVNCPMAGWDIMAGDDMVHPNPVFKEFPCTEWISAVDLATVLTPGVEKVLTLPPAEFVRDNSYFFLENENVLGERLYLWSAGSGFDRPGHPATGGFAGAGVLIMHTDTGMNPEADPPQQNTPPFSYVIVQADGLFELDDGHLGGGGATCEGVPDDGDPWPGRTNKRVFNCNTVPASRWNTGSACTGLEISNVELDGNGGALVTMKWAPMNIPSLSFIDPPGGASVPVASGKVRYRVKFDATDLYGGTMIKMYYTADDDPVAALAGGSAKEIGTVDKPAPGTIGMSMDWNIASPRVPDGRYQLFAKLIPGVGADGLKEKSKTDPRPGRNNVGEGSLLVTSVDVAKSRTETWTVELHDVDGTHQNWLVYSTLSLPRPDGDTIPAAQLFKVPVGGTASDRFGANQEVQLTLSNAGVPFHQSDRFTFVTTGITPLSKAIVIDDGEINEGPKAVISASPLSGPPPLVVTFSAVASTDPEGAPLDFVWDFGDGSALETGIEPTHAFTEARTFTVVLQVTNRLNGLSDDASVDIDVTNNSPSARIMADPTSGGPDLEVSFDASQSDDAETPLDELIYQWEFGDGWSVNDAGTPGVAITTKHVYTSRADGTPCTPSAPCTFTAMLTVTDTGGKSDVDTEEIQVGNSRPKANIKYSALQGPAPWTVIFNAINSSDPDGDDLTVDWKWGDGSSDLGLPLTGSAGQTDGQVKHVYEEGGSYRPVVTLRDGRGGVTIWSAVTVLVRDMAASFTAAFVIETAQPLVNEPVSVNASGSSPASQIASYNWDWGDGTSESHPEPEATHTYTDADEYTIKLTIADAKGEQSASTSQTLNVTDDVIPPPGPPTNQPPLASFVVRGGPVQANAGVAGETEFTFDASSSRDPDGDDDELSFDWAFGDGTFLNNAAAVVTHVFETANTYTVRLTVRDELDLAASATHLVEVSEERPNRDPAAVITTGPRSGPVPFAVTFTTGLSYDPDGDSLEYSWLIGHDGAEVRLTTDVQGRWLADAWTGEVTVCLDDAVAGLFWSTDVACPEDYTAGDGEDTLIESPTVNGATLGAEFRIEGAFTVQLEVSDGRGASDLSGVERVEVTASFEPEPPQPTPPPDDGGEQDSAAQRPSGGFCGLGMLTGLFASLAGLTVMMAGRRRFRP